MKKRVIKRYVLWETDREEGEVVGIKLPIPFKVVHIGVDRHEYPFCPICVWVEIDEDVQFGPDDTIQGNFTTVDFLCVKYCEPISERFTYFSTIEDTRFSTWRALHVYTSAKYLT